ncbi:MAG: hypothetical protein AAGJ37_03370 [Pseudomonadota bacterium]
MDSTTNAYATQEFIKFAVKDRLSASYLLNMPGNIPFWLTTKGCANPSILSKKETLSAVTPICFSGPTKGDASRIVNTIIEHNPAVAAGFIQTRIEGNGDETADAILHRSHEEQAAIYEDFRTNYRIPLHLGVDELKSRMKRDSRSRVNKLKGCMDTFTIDTDKSKQNIQSFTDLYKHTASKNSFSHAYCFEYEDWDTLLQNPLWYLVTLHKDNVMVGGAVLASVPDGFDYAFMAYDDASPDLSRLLILVSYEFASSLHDDEGYFYLGGGISEEDALARFKISMGGEAIKFKRIKFAQTRDLLPSISQHELKAQMSMRWP